MNKGYTFLFGLLSVAMMGTIAQAQIRSDNFNLPTLNSYWVFINPRGDATQTMTGTQARISVPLGFSHDPVDIGSGGNMAPRLAQQIATPATDFGNFTVYAKFDAPMTLLYQQVGIEVIQDPLNSVRCEFYSDGTSIKYLLWAFDNTGTAEGLPRYNVTIATNGTTPLYMKLQRVGTKFIQSYNLTGSNPWIVTDSLTHVMNADSMAVYAANSDGTYPGTTAPAFAGLIDDFSTSDPLPVQLASFTGTVVNQTHVRLDWTTITETNNFGFYVQKSQGNTNAFTRIEGSFLPGHGTTITPHSYSYIDNTTPGSWTYRLEQIDLDGITHYSDPVHVDVLTGVGDTKSLPTDYALGQNYPNPFNPSTIIKFELPKDARVQLEIYNLIGQKVATLIDANKAAGSYQIPFNASGLTSGVYMYKLSAGSQVFTKKMVLMK